MCRISELSISGVAHIVANGRSLLRLDESPLGERVPQKVGVLTGAASASTSTLREATVSSTISRAKSMPARDADRQQPGFLEKLSLRWVLGATLTLFMTVAAAVSIDALPHAWIAWACVVYFLLGCSCLGILRKRAAGSAPLLALMIGAVVVFASAGTWVLRDGIGDGRERLHRVGHEANRALDAIGQTVANAGNSLREVAWNLAMGVTAEQAAEQAMARLTVKALVKATVNSGGHGTALAFAELEVSPAGASVPRASSAGKAGSQSLSGEPGSGPGGAPASPPTTVPSAGSIPLTDGSTSPTTAAGTPSAGAAAPQEGQGATQTPGESAGSGSSPTPEAEAENLTGAPPTPQPGGTEAPAPAPTNSGPGGH